MKVIWNNSAATRNWHFSMVTIFACLDLGIGSPWESRPVFSSIINIHAPLGIHKRDKTNVSLTWIRCKMWFEISLQQPEVTIISTLEATLLFLDLGNLWQHNGAPRWHYGLYSTKKPWKGQDQYLSPSYWTWKVIWTNSAAASRHYHFHIVSIFAFLPLDAHCSRMMLTEWHCGLCPSWKPQKRNI